MAEEPEGKAWLQQLQDEGHDDADIELLKADKAAAAIEQGYTQQEVDDFFGDTPPQPSATLGNVIKDNLARAKWNPIEIETKGAQGWFNSFVTGAEWSATSMLAHGAPKHFMPEDAGIVQNILYGAGQGIADAPTMFASFLGAAPAGPMAGVYSMGAVPAAIRKVVIDDAQHGTPQSADEVLYRAWDTLKEANTGGVANVVGGKVGEAVGAAVAPYVAKPVMKASEATAMALAATGTASAIQGHVPGTDEWVAGVALAAFLPGGKAMYDGIVRVVGARERAVLTDTGEQIKDRMQDLWAKTGVKPLDAGRAASTDPVLHQTLIASDADGQPITKPWENMAPEEPKPMKPTVEDAKFTTEEVKPPPTEVAPLAVTGKYSPDTGIPPIKNVSGEDLGAILMAADQETGAAPKPPENLDELAKKYVNEDGSVDLEAVLIEHDAGAAEAKVFRANGRKFNRLPPNTQRYLEKVGAALGEGGFKDEPKAEAGGGGKKPPPPPPPGDQAALPAPGDKPFKRAWEFVADDINTGVSTPKNLTTWERAVDTWRSAKTNWGEFSPAKEFDRMVGNDKKATDIGLDDLMRLAKGYDGRTHARVEWGGIRMVLDKTGNFAYDINPDVPSYASIWKRAAKLKGGQEQFQAYLQALTTLDRAKRGLKTTTDPKVAQEAMENVPAKLKAEYDKLASDHQKAMTDTLEGSIVAGTLNRKQVDAFLERHPNWFPQMTLKDAQSYHGVARGVRQLFKKAKGHEYQLQDQRLSVLDAINKRENFNSINIARRGAVDWLKKYFNENPSASKEVDVARPGMGHNGGPPLDEGPVTDADKEFFKFNPNDILYYEDGVVKSYPVKDFPGRDQFMEMIMSEHAFTKDIAGNILGLAAKIERSGIVNMPSFFLRNLAKDSVWAAISSKYGGVPIVNSFHGISAILDTALFGPVRKSKDGMITKLHARYVLNGGYGAALSDVDANHTLERFNGFKDTGHFNSIPNSMGTMMTVLRTMSRAADTTNRVGGPFKNAEGKIGTIKAAALSRRIMGDFAEGSNSQLLNVTTNSTPFFRAWQRGQDATIEAFTKDFPGTMARSALFIAAPAMVMTLIAYAVQDLYEDEIPDVARLENQPRDSRDMNTYIPGFDGHGNFTWYTIPATFGPGVLINAMSHSFIDWIKETDPRAWSTMLDRMRKQYLAVPLPFVENPYIKIPLMSTTGVDPTMGRPIIPARLQGMNGNQQYFEYTTETAKSAARIINSMGADLSPITLEKYLDTVTGNAGVQLLKILDAVTRSKENEQPRDIANNIWVMSFVARNPVMNTQPIQDFYDDYEVYKKAKGDVKIMEQRWQFDEAIDASQLDALLVQMDDAAAAMANHRADIYAIQDNPIFKADDKRQLIDLIAGQMILLAQVMNSQVDLFRGGVPLPAAAEVAPEVTDDAN